MKSKSPQQFLQVEEKVREKSEDTEQKGDGIHILTGSSLLLEKDKHGSNKGCYSGLGLRIHLEFVALVLLESVRNSVGRCPQDPKKQRYRGGHEHVVRNCLCGRRK